MESTKSDLERKGIARKRLFQILKLLICLTFVIIFALNIMKIIVKDSLKEKKETEHFIFYCSKEDKDLLLYLPDSLENNYKRISSDLKTEFPKKVVIRIYPNPALYRMSFGNPLPWPKRIGGSAGNRSITVVSPEYLPYYMNLNKVLAHEMTHLIKNEINPLVKGGWLSEGIASYEGNEISDTWIATHISDQIEKGEIPTFKELDNYTYQQFESRYGYLFSYTIIKFIVEEYGYDNLIDLLKSPNDFNGVFHMSEDDFYSKWIEYIRDTY